MENVLTVAFVVAVLLVMVAKLSVKSASTWLVFNLTTASILLSFADRDLSFSTANNSREAFTKAVCLADGIILGLTLSLHFLRIIEQFSHRPDGLIRKLEDLAGPFALYSLAVGGVLSVMAFRDLTLMQIFTYVFVCATNFRFAKRFLQRDDSSEKKGTKR